MVLNRLFIFVIGTLAGAVPHLGILQSTEIEGGGVPSLCVLRINILLFGVPCQGPHTSETAKPQAFKPKHPEGL